jgi:hypothetical protein
MNRPDIQLPVVFDRLDALSAGLTAGQVDRRSRGHDWDRLRRGFYTVSPLADDTRWRAEVLAAVRAHRRTLVLSHTCAARAWGLLRPSTGWGPLIFTSPLPPAVRNVAQRILTAPLDDSEVVPVGRILVTSPARAAVDCARLLAPRDGLAVVDAVLHARLCTLDELQGVLERQRGWPGAPRARAVVALADGRRETTLESWSAWSFSEQGLLMPTWQVTLLDIAGVFLGRVDGWWEEGVAGEADGRLKYRLAALERGGVDADGLAAALHEERAREQRLRRAGVSVVRWSARDVLNPGAARSLAEHIRAELARGGRFTGRAVLV